MRLRHVAGRDGDEAGEPGLRRQQIVVRAIEPPWAVGIGQPIADREELTVAIVEKAEPHAGQPARDTGAPS